MAGLGNPKTGGRAKGSPNRSTLAFQKRIEELRERGLDCCPIRVLAELALGRTLEGEDLPVDPAVRVRAAAQLCSHLYPTLKAVELSSGESRPISFHIVKDE